MRIRTFYLACALPIAVCMSCGSDSPPACKDAPACTAKPTLNVGGVACGLYGTPCPTAKPACTKPVAPSSGVQEIPLGTKQVGTVVSFNVPAGTTSITIIEQANGTDATTTPPDTVTLTNAGNSFQIENTAVPDKLKNPGGDIVYDDNPPSPPPADPSGQTAFFASGSPVTGAFTIPNTSKLLSTSVNGLASGQWQFVVNDFGFECFGASNCTGGSKTSTYDVRVVLKGGAPHTSGTVDVAFYLVGSKATGGSLPTAAQAPTDPGINRMVSTLSNLYASTGICLGNVTFFDVPGWAEAAYGGVLDVRDTSPCSPLNQMFTLSVPGNQLNFFLVNSLAADPNGNSQVVGIDGTIPGPSAFGGTIHSGAAVNGSDMDTLLGCGAGLTISDTCGADVVAYIAAHEGGHWLGLYHTTESSGDNFDPLADTAKCPCDPCVPQNDRSQCTTPDPNLPPVLNGTNCTKSTSCGGGDDLMFWLLGGRSTGRLTCEQGAVMRANPVVH